MHIYIYIYIYIGARRRTATVPWSQRHDGTWVLCDNVVEAELRKEEVLCPPTARRSRHQFAAEVVLGLYAGRSHLIFSSPFQKVVVPTRPKNQIVEVRWATI